MEYAKQINADVAVVSTDYSKAYDLVQHDPLFAIAKRIGGDDYRYSQWLRTMYTGHQRFIIANGVISPSISRNT